MRSFSKAWFLEQRSLTKKRGYLWPGFIVFFIFGLGGVAWCAYNGWWSGVAFTLFWLLLLVSIFGPCRRGWQRQQGQRATER